MLRFGRIFLASLIRVFGFLCRYAYRPKSSVVKKNGSDFSVNHSQNDDEIVSKNSMCFLSSGLPGKEILDLQKNKLDSNGRTADEESSVFLQSCLIANSNECQFIPGKHVSGYFEEPKTDKFVVLHSSDQSLGCEVENSLDQRLERTLKEFDVESDSSSISFKLFDVSCSTNEDIQGSILGPDSTAPEKADNPLKFSSSEEVYEEKERLNSDECEDLLVEGVEFVDLEDHDVSYEVELLPVSQFSEEPDASGDDILNNTQEIDTTDRAIYDPKNWMSSFLEESDRIKPEDLEEEHDTDHTQGVEDLDDEYIELEPQSMSLTHVGKETICCRDANKVEELSKHDEEVILVDSSQERRSAWDDDNDDEADILWEHWHLVQQMKMELKNCRIQGLPTISEECETPKMEEDLKPLNIDQKIEYKDIREEIQKFHKSYVEKMRKLDVLNYQTLHAISFLQLKVSEVLTAGKRKTDSLPFNLRKIRPCKVQRIHADPMHKSIVEMHCDLELAYVGQLCLSWEILCWLYVKARELLGHDPSGSHSYNQAADEFQQFQVLLQRFIEDEPFQGQRIQNYVKSRCTIRCLLQVPTIRDDCLKTKKERREETDAISLEMLVEIIRESMLIFREFLFADKRSLNTVLKGVHATKVEYQEPTDSELLVDLITDLQKKERKIREHIRSQNCIVKRLKKHQECALDHEVLTCQVELRLVSRVLSLSRLSTDQLVWCQNKLKHISFVRRKVHVAPSFSLFPC